jgi:hypothetical protein
MINQQPLWAPNEKEQRSDPRTTTPSQRSRANRSPEADPLPATWGAGQGSVRS